jgi:hypothetical protein
VSELIEFRLEGGGAVVVEMDEEQAGLVPAGRRPGEIAREAAQTFEEAIASIRPAAQVIAQELRSLKPDELGIEIGIKLTAEAGAIIAKAGGEANFKVTLKWTLEHSAEKPEPANAPSNLANPDSAGDDSGRVPPER